MADDPAVTWGALRRSHPKRLFSRVNSDLPRGPVESWPLLSPAYRKVPVMAAPRTRSDPVDDEILPETQATVLAEASPATSGTGRLPEPPTIHDVMDMLSAYLLTQYADSLTDQEAVYDAARMVDDGHVIPAWRHLAHMVEQVLNVPPGG